MVSEPARLWKVAIPLTASPRPPVRMIRPVFGGQVDNAGFWEGPAGGARFRDLRFLGGLRCLEPSCWSLERVVAFRLFRLPGNRRIVPVQSTLHGRDVAVLGVFPHHPGSREPCSGGEEGVFHSEDPPSGQALFVLFVIEGNHLPLQKGVEVLEHRRHPGPGTP